MQGVPDAESIKLAAESSAIPPRPDFSSALSLQGVGGESFSRGFDGKTPREELPRTAAYGGRNLLTERSGLA